MPRFSRTFKVTLLVISIGLSTLALLFYIVVVAPFTKIGHLHSKYDTIQKGASKDHVVAVMGKPTRVRNDYGWEKVYWEDTPLPDQPTNAVAQSMWYSVKTFFLPISFVFSFDSEGKLIGKHRFD